MDRKSLFVITGIVILVVGAFVYVITKPNTQKNNESNTTTGAEATPSDASTTPPSTTQSKTGAYINYSANLVASTPGTKLLFFHAPWCPQCRAMEESIKKEELPSGVTVFKVDYDSNQKLRQKHDVTLQTTFVKIDDNGNKIASYVAYEQPEFSNVERALLP